MSRHAERKTDEMSEEKKGARRGEEGRGAAGRHLTFVMEVKESFSKPKPMAAISATEQPPIRLERAADHTKRGKERQTMMTHLCSPHAAA